MATTVLVTGGAGFIGSHLCDELLEKGYNVRVLDNLSPQVHGTSGTPPEYLNSGAEFLLGDVRDSTMVERALNGADAVVHLAAAVGVGQSMYEIEKYTSVNNLGTAVLLEALIKRPVEKLVVASSLSIYGEGLYRSEDGTLHYSAERPIEQLKEGKWELHDRSGILLAPMPTPETKPPSISSVYALSKFDQERLALITGRAYNIPTIALRFFNVFGTRQALSNPYTGVLAIFASRFLNNKPPLIYEDGNQRRDFVSVYDVVQACRLALESTSTGTAVYNVGSGRSYTINEVAEKMASVLNKPDIGAEITGKYRLGDIRHCYSDITLIETRLGYKPRVSLQEGLQELSEWLSGQIAYDRVDMANMELENRGLKI